MSYFVQMLDRGVSDCTITTNVYNGQVKRYLYLPNL